MMFVQHASVTVLDMIYNKEKCVGLLSQPIIMCEDTGMFNMDVSEVGSAIVELALGKRERKK